MTSLRLRGPTETAALTRNEKCEPALKDPRERKKKRRAENADRMNKKPVRSQAGGTCFYLLENTMLT
jgi:hypothetical protein